MKKIRIVAIFILSSIIITSCAKPVEQRKKTKIEISEEIVAPEEGVSSPSLEDAKTLIVEEEVDLSSYFEGLTGSAVIYEPAQHSYQIYNREVAEKPASPCSTFKIIASLLGLKYDVVADKDSVMGYDGTVYKRAEWNKELTLAEAFQVSGVWYFRKIIRQLEPGQVKEELQVLNYGNADVEHWPDEGNEVMEGFWLESTLQVTPRNQVEVISNLFEGESQFAEGHIQLLTEIMQVENEAGLELYGKTGSGYDKTKECWDGWFVGMVNKSGDTRYFAVKLEGESQEQAGGARAKEIAIRILEDLD